MKETLIDIRKEVESTPNCHFIKGSSKIMVTETQYNDKFKVASVKKVPAKALANVHILGCDMAKTKDGWFLMPQGYKVSGKDTHTYEVIEILRKNLYRLEKRKIEFAHELYRDLLCPLPILFP